MAKACIAVATGPQSFRTPCGGCGGIIRGINSHSQLADESDRADFHLVRSPISMAVLINSQTGNHMTGSALLEKSPSTQQSGRTRITPGPSYRPFEKAWTEI